MWAGPLGLPHPPTALNNAGDVPQHRAPRRSSRVVAAPATGTGLRGAVPELAHPDLDRELASRPARRRSGNRRVARRDTDTAGA
jgi:hypothetical protein